METPEESHYSSVMRLLSCHFWAFSSFVFLVGIDVYASRGAMHTVNLSSDIKRLEAKPWLTMPWTRAADSKAPATLVMEKFARDGVGLSEVSVPGDSGDPTPQDIAWAVSGNLANDPKTFWNRALSDDSKAEIKANLGLIKETFTNSIGSGAIGLTWVLHVVGDDAAARKLLIQNFQEEIERGMQQKAWGYSLSHAEFFREGIEKFGTEKEKSDATESLTKLKVHLSNIMPPSGGGSGT